MKAGRMTTHLTLFRAEVTRDEFNAEETEWVCIGGAMAERVRQTGRYGVQGGELFADYQVRFNLRDGHKVVENDRVRERGGHLYQVTQIERNRRRGMITITCDRVNR